MTVTITLLRIERPPVIDEKLRRAQEKLDQAEAAVEKSNVKMLALIVQDRLAKDSGHANLIQRETKLQGSDSSETGAASKKMEGAIFDCARLADLMEELNGLRRTEAEANDELHKVRREIAEMVAKATGDAMAS